MRRFRFRLERFLEIKRYRERQAELTLAAATARCLELKNRMAEARSLMAQELALRAGGAGRLDVERLQWGELYRRHLTGVYESSVRSLVAREEERREANRVYLERSRDRKVLDKLRERREREYYHEARGRAARALDDVSQAGRVARSSGGE